MVASPVRLVAQIRVGGGSFGAFRFETQTKKEMAFTN